MDGDRPNPTPAGRSSHLVRDLAVVVGVSWLARALFIVAFPDAQSVDVDGWHKVLKAVEDGRNPYEIGRLNWPPLWLVVIVAVDAVAGVVHISFLNALRVFLVLVESCVVVALYVVLVNAGASRTAVRRSLLVGIALNPVAILLVCQHVNSDVIVGLFVVLALGSLLAYRRSTVLVYWLTGSLFLGLGVLAKTVALVLAPLLAPGARRASTAEKWLGAALFLGPVALGSSVVAAFGWDAFAENVLRYRSSSGYFGISGLLTWAIDKDVSSVFETGFLVLSLTTIVWLWFRLSREQQPLGPQVLFLLTALLLLAIPVLGPGYGTQYIYWCLPVLIGTYVLLDDSWRTLLRIGYVVAGATYVAEYAFSPSHGAFANHIWSGSWVAELNEAFVERETQTLLTLPLFVVYMLVIVLGVRRLTRDSVWRL